MSPRCLSPSHVLLTGDRPNRRRQLTRGSMTEQTRLMLGKDKDGVAYKGFMDAVKRINAEGGMGRFFSGVGPRTMWISIGGCVFFGAYEGHHLSSRSMLTCLAWPHARACAHTSTHSCRAVCLARWAARCCLTCILLDLLAFTWARAHGCDVCRRQEGYRRIH